MSSEDTRRRVSAAMDMPGGIEAPVHAKLREELARDPESKAWAEDVGKLDALLRSWPEDTRSDDAWEGLAARIDQRLHEALPGGLDFTTPPFFDDEDARMGRPDASSGRIGTAAARQDIEAKRAEFSLSQLSHLDAPKSAAPPPTPPPPTPPRAGNPKLELLPAVLKSPVPSPKPASPPVDERFSIPTFSAPIAPIAPLPTAAPEKPKRGPWLLLGGAGLAAAAVVLFAVLVLPGLSSPPRDAAASAAALPMAAEQSPMNAAPVAAESPSEEPAAATAVPMAVSPSPPPVVAAPRAALRGAGAAVGGGAPQGGHALGAVDVEGGPARPAMHSPAESTAPAASPGARRPSPRPAGGGAGGGGATDSPRPGGTKLAPSGGAVAATPSREDVIAAMGSVRAPVAACAQGRGGVALVRVTFAGPSGRVTGAVVGGQFAGTTQGSCIARAVRAASVPRFAQPTFEVSFPFQL